MTKFSWSYSFLLLTENEDADTPDRSALQLVFNSPTNMDLKITILYVVINPHRVLIKSSKSLENKGFIAQCSP